jgi:hypothetical protein
VALTAEATQVKEYIYEDLDLGAARALGAATYGWNAGTVDSAEHAYRDFLWVCWNYDRGGRSIAAISVLADKFWHCHMLLPAPYQRDCARIFGPGHVLDHTPVLPAGQRVQEADEKLAREEYAKLGLELPADLRNQCIWAVVS